MKFKVIILLFSILLISPYVHSNSDVYEISDMTPDVLIPAELLANLTNSTFEIITEGFSDQNINIFVAGHDVINKNARVLMLFFFIASILKQLDSIESFTPFSFYKSVIYLLISLWLINNSQVVFDFLSQLKDTIAFSMNMNKQQLIDFNSIVQDWNNNLLSVDMLSKTEEAVLIVSYTQSMLLSFVAILILGVVLFLRLVKLQVYQIFAPYMFSAVTFKDTISLTLSFLKDYILTYFMILLIIFITNKFLSFGDSLSTNYFMVFIQNTLLSVIIVKLRSLTFHFLKLGKKGLKFINTVRKSPNKLQTALSLSRGKLNRMGHASTINRLPSTVPSYLIKRKNNIKTLFSKEGRKSITKEKIKEESIKFSKETFEEFRERLNNMGYAPAVNRLPSYVKDRANKVKGIPSTIMKSTNKLFKKEDYNE